MANLLPGEPDPRWDCDAYPIYTFLDAEYATAME
jgi:hypothetical protein